MTYQFYDDGEFPNEEKRRDRKEYDGHGIVVREQAPW